MSIPRVIWLGAPLFAAASASAQHGADMWVGRSGGQLALSPSGMIPGTLYNPLDRVETFIHGWSNNDPGFDHVVGVQGGVSPLSGGVEVWLKVVSLDPALFVIDNGFNILDSPGDRSHLGGSTLHEHITWFIDRTDPGFDPEQCVWEGTFKLVDLGTTHLGDSTTFTLLFSNVPVRGGEFPPMPTAATGDFDGDRDVDAFDYAAFTVCYDGPGVRPAPDDPDITTCEVDCFNAFDADDDFDSDLEDFAAFQREFDP